MTTPRRRAHKNRICLHGDFSRTRYGLKSQRAPREAVIVERVNARTNMTAGFKKPRRVEWPRRAGGAGGLSTYAMYLMALTRKQTRGRDDLLPIPAKPPIDLLKEGSRW